MQEDLEILIDKIREQIPVNWEEAKLMIDDLEKDKTNLSEPDSGMLLSMLKGDLLFFKFEYPKAIKLYNESFDIATELGDRNVLGQVNLKIGRCFHNTSDFELAQKYYGKAAEIFEQLDDQVQLARSLNNLGNAYFRMSDFEKAAAHYLKANRIFKEQGDDVGASYSMNNLGNLYHRIKQYDEAHKYYSEVLDIFRKRGDIRSEAIALNNLGNVLVNNGDPERALGHFYRSAQLRETTGDQSGIAIVYMNIADVLSGLEKIDEAMKYVQDALTIYKKAGQKFWYGTASIILSKLYARSKEYEKAVETINTSISLGTETGAKDLLWEAYLEKSKICESLGDIKAAYDSFKKYTTIKDELFNEDRNRVIVEMQKKFEAEAKEKEAMIYYLKNVELREKNDELEKQSIELKEQKERAERSEKFKEEFLANMSHEIRTPMNAIMGITKLLIRNDPRRDQQDYLSAISRSSDNLLVIINDILDLSKIEAGKMELEEISFNIKEHLQNVKEILSFKAEEKNIKLELLADNDLPQFLKGDPTRLNQILINLAGNAIKFTEHGKVEIKVGSLKSNAASSSIRFSVKDTGIGIPKERLEAIFESFGQASGDTTRKFGGTGLGLTISQKLVTLMGSKIKVDSEPGKGSCFYFDLDMDHAELMNDKGQELSENVRDLLRSCKVLLVEDNEFNIMVAVDTLENEIPDISLDIARNGKEALDMVGCGDYQLILMDIQMPVMNGLEATRAIREMNNSKSSIPIMAMTAHAIKAEIDRCFEAGMDQYITKPFDINELINKMYSLISWNE